MRDPSLEQVADGRESDVGMRPDIRVAKLVGRQVQGAGMIEEDERPDHAALPEGEDAIHREAAAEVGLARVDHEFRHKEDSRSEEHTSELQTLMRISYAVFCLKKKIHKTVTTEQRP